MSGHRAPDQSVRLSFRGKLLLAALTFGALLLATGGIALGAALATGPAYTHQCVIAETPKPGGGFTRTEDCDPLTPSTSPSATPSPSSSPTPAPSPSASPTSTPTPSPSTSTTPPATTPPATTPPPSPTPTGPVTNCLAAPARCGFPDASTTGPTGPLAVTTKTVYSTAGQLVANVQINGCVEIRAAGVTFRNVLFNGPGCMFPVRNYGGGAVLEDVEMTCGRQPGSSGFVNTGTGTVTLRRADIHDCENGLSSGIGSITLVDSWIRVNMGLPSHSDGAQFDKGAANIVFQHNTIDARGDTTSAIMMWTEEDPQNHDVTIANNLMAGGAYTVYCGRSGTAVKVTIANNRFGPYSYGYANACDSGGEVWSGNVDDATGKALAAA